MKKTNRGTLVGLIMALTFLTMTGFDRPGAHSVQVYLDGDLILERYVDTRSVAPTLPLDLARNYKALIIRYSECGRTVDGRRLTLLNKNGLELRTWKFEGVTAGLRDPMICPIKDIPELVNKGNSEIGIRYLSKDFPEGIHILTLEAKGNVQASRD